MDLTPASGFKRRPAASSSSPGGVREVTRSPPPRSPSSSPSSPSSAPSSPSSTSSSVCVNSYQNHVKGPGQGTAVARVSSTSASLAAQPLCTATPNTASSELRPPTKPRGDFEEESGKREMYDPFHPTEGAKGGEGEGEKYDPFDPTNSPVSDDGSAKIRGLKRTAERDDDDEEKEEEPPDSTDALSPRLTNQLPLRRRVDCTSFKTGEQSADSDHSEIEEGEIADRDAGNKRASGEIPIGSPSVSFFGSKPERILRVLDGDGFVSVRAESNWEADREPEDEPVVGVEDLRRKLVSRRKERYLSFPASSALSPPPPPPPSSHPPASPPSSPPLTPPVEPASKSRSKSSKSSKDGDRQKSKDRKAGEKEERRKKSRKEKDGGQERSKDKERGHKSGKEAKGRRSSRSSSRKRKKKQHSSPEASRSSSGRGHTRHSFSSLSEERQREKEKDRTRDRGRDRDREQSWSHRRDDRDRDSSSRKEERDRKGRPHSDSRERGLSKRSKRSRDSREGDLDLDRDRDRPCDRERRRDGRPVVPPSIQDLNGSDLFAISPAQFILHSSLPLVGCNKTPPSLLHPSMGGGCAQTPPSIMPAVTGSSGDAGWDSESRDPDKYLKKLHTQERAVEEVKLAIKPYYQRKDINKDEYKDILRKAVHKICHSRTGEINPVKVSNLVKLYVQRYKYFRKHGRKMDEEEREERETGALHSSA